MEELSENSCVQKKLRFIHLIVFEKGVTTKYFDRCKVVIKNHRIIVTPDDQDANQINWKISDNFIQFKNFICFFSSVCGFALVFDFVKDCQHVYKVLDRKKLNYGNSQLTSTSLERRFIVPLIKELSNYSQLNFDFRCFILKLFKSLDVEQKQRLSDVLIETKIHKSLLDCVFEDTDYDPSETPKAVQQDDDHEDTSNDNQRTIFGRSFTSSSSRRVTFEDSITEGDSIFEGDNDCSPTPSKKPRLSNDTSPSKTAEPISSPFQVIDYTQSGVSKTHLFIFTSDERSHCFEFYWEYRSQRFRCVRQGCRKAYPVVKKDSDGIDRVYFANEQCPCLPREFIRGRFQDDIPVYKDDYKIVNEIYKGKEKQRLYVYASEDKKKAYKFDFDVKGNRFLCIKCRSQRYLVRAVLCKNADGEEHVAIQDKMHKCQPIDC